MSLLIEKAIKAIHNDECVVFPTETVYGLGADATNKKAVLKIFEYKNRPTGNPLIVHVPNIEEIFSVACSLSLLEEKIFKEFSPGPISVILRKKEDIPIEVTGGLETVGVRIPNHPIALEFLSRVKKPICAPSANISGKPSPTTLEMAKYYMQDKVPIILDGGTLDIGIESTVIKVEENNIYILRSGFITSEMIEEKIGIKPREDSKISHLSPGTRFAHYKPKAKVILFDKQNKLEMIRAKSALLYLSDKINTKGFDYHIRFGSVKEYSRYLYSTFFACDKSRINEIYCEIPDSSGESRALIDRLSKAAGFY